MSTEIIKEQEPKDDNNSKENQEVKPTGVRTKEERERIFKEMRDIFGQ